MLEQTNLRYRAESRKGIPSLRQQRHQRTNQGPESKISLLNRKNETEDLLLLKQPQPNTYKSVEGICKGISITPY